MVPSTKVIFSRRLKEELVKRGFRPICKREDVKREGYYVWEFEETSEFLEAFVELVSGKEEDNG